MLTYINKIKQFDRKLRFFYAASALHSFTFFGIYTLLLNLYLLRLGYGPELIGVVNGTGPLVLALGSVPAGQLSRRIGSRKAIVLGYTFVGIGFMLLPFSNLLPAAIQPSWITTSYALAWLAGALVIVNYNPFLMGSTSDSQRNHAFALHVAIFPLFGFLGNLLGGFLPGLFASFLSITLASPTPYALVLFIGGSLYLISAFLMGFTNEVKQVATKPNALLKPNEKVQPAKPPYQMLLMVLIFAVFAVAGDWAMRIYVNVYLDSVLEVSTALIGTMSALAQLIGMIALISPWLIDRWGRKKVLLYGYIVAALTFLPIIFIAQWAAVGVSLIAMTVVGSLINPAFGIFTQTRVSSEWRTTMASITAVATGIGVALTAFGGSRIVTAFGFQTLFAGGAVSLLAGALSFWLFFYRKQADKHGEDRTRVLLPKSKPGLVTAPVKGGNP